jgi:nucleoside-diphosphate-sugar epimerase
MKVAVFGSSGFIGKNVVTSLQKICKVYEISLRNSSWVNDVEVDTKVFLNLVGKAHDHDKIATKEDFFHVNFDFVKDIFKAFINSDANLFIHISSIAAVEEFESKSPLTEENVCRPYSWYGKSKREAELWLMKQNLPEGKKMIILRPPMVHGEGDKGNLLLLYRLISKGIPYPLASFQNRRSFVSIENFCFFIKEIINRPDSLSNRIYHISDDDLVSTNEIINIIKQVTKKNTLDVSLPKVLVKTLAKIGDFLPIPLNSIRLKKMTSDFIVSNQKIKSELGIGKLPLTAKEGLIKTIKNIKL